MADGPQRTAFTEYYRPGLNDVLFRWIDHRKVAILRHAFSTLPDDSLIVDIGAGGGTIASRLQRLGHSRLLCLDKDPELLARCASLGLETRVLDFDAPLPIADHTAAGVLMIDAIEHVVEPRRVMSEIRRIVQPGGVVVLFTPPYDSIRWLLAERIHKLVTGRNADHIAPFTRESFDFLVGSFFTDYELGRANFNLSMYAVIRACESESGRVSR